MAARLAAAWNRRFLAGYLRDDLDLFTLFPCKGDPFEHFLTLRELVLFPESLRPS